VVEKMPREQEQQERRERQEQIGEPREDVVVFVVDEAGLIC
jgi:hypothetical protein